MQILRRSRYFSIRILAGSLLSLPLAYAAGVGAGGGGHIIESGFKTKVLGIADECVDMADSARALLKFDPDELKATLNADNRFKPLCANIETGTLDRIRKSGKMAQVFDSEPNIVRLNCTDFELDQWEKRFSSKTEKDILFFLHEGLRIHGEETHEDDYGKSSSYLKASREQQNIIQGIAYRMIYPSSNDKCRLLVEVDSGYSAGERERISYVVNGNVVFDTGWSKGAMNRDMSRNWIINAILNGSGYLGVERKKIFELYRNFGC